jgi:hypothetical protein
VSGCTRTPCRDRIVYPDPRTPPPAPPSWPPRTPTPTSVTSSNFSRSTPPPLPSSKPSCSPKTQKAVDQLREIQDERHCLKRRRLTEAAELFLRHQHKRLPSAPVDDGFVFFKRTDRAPRTKAGAQVLSVPDHTVVASGTLRQLVRAAGKTDKEYSKPSMNARGLRSAQRGWRRRLRGFWRRNSRGLPSWRCGLALRE